MSSLMFAVVVIGEHTLRLDAETWAAVAESGELGLEVVQVTGLRFAGMGHTLDAVSPVQLCCTAVGHTDLNPMA